MAAHLPTGQTMAVITAPPPPPLAKLLCSSNLEKLFKAEGMALTQGLLRKRGRTLSSESQQPCVEAWRSGLHCYLALGESVDPGDHLV